VRAEVKEIRWQNLSISAIQMECSEHHEPGKTEIVFHATLSDALRALVVDGF